MIQYFWDVMRNKQLMDDDIVPTRATTMSHKVVSLLVCTVSTYSIQCECPCMCVYVYVYMSGTGPWVMPGKKRRGKQEGGGTHTGSSKQQTRKDGPWKFSERLSVGERKRHESNQVRAWCFFCIRRREEDKRS